MSIENRKAELSKKDKSEVLAILALADSKDSGYAPVPSIITARWGHLTKNQLTELILVGEYPDYQSTIETEKTSVSEAVPEAVVSV